MEDAPIEQLRRILNAGHEATLSEITDEIGVSRRHTRRLINQLRDEGMKVNERWEEGVKQFVLDPSSRQIDGKLHLEEEELFALIVSTYAAQSVLSPTPMEEGLKTVAEKLLAEAGPVYSFEPEWQRRVWHFDERQDSNIDPRVFQTVVRAANRCETLEVDYFSASSREKSTGRRVDPLVIAEQGDSWLLAAYCHEKSAVLDFALPGISRAEPTGSYFQRPEGFDPEAHFESRFHALKGEGGHEVTLEVGPEKAPYFRRKSYHPSQEIRETHEDGNIVVEFEVSSLDDIAAFIRSWGPGVWVTRPEHLAEHIAEEAQMVADGYERNGTGEEP